MTTTQNLHLPQFAETDRIHHDDFNDAFAKIDANCGNCRIATGSYVGTGEFGSSHKNTLTLPFVPKLLIILHGTGAKAFITPEMVTADTGGSSIASNIHLQWDGTTVEWYSDDSNAGYQMNSNGTTYRYIAIT